MKTMLIMALKSKKVRQLLMIAIAIIVVPILSFVVLLASFQQQQNKAEEESKTNGTCSVSGGSVSKKGIKTFEKSAKGGKLEDKGEYMVKSAKKHKIDPRIFMAIVAHETGYGKSEAIKTHNNPAGLMGSGSLHKYDTINDGIDAAAKNLYDLYFSQGLKTVDKIQKKYAPLGVANDPDNLNANWSPTIKKIMKTIDGKDSDSNKGCTDDSSSDGKGFDFKGEFPKPDKSKFTLQPTYPFGQCTWYVHQRRHQIGKDVPTTLGNGGDWGDKAPMVGFKVGKTPKVGAAASIKPGIGGAPPIYGHVAFVEKVNKDGSIMVSESNVEGLGTISTRKFSKDEAKTMKFIYGKK
ncbi:CHAP domain-containing protein [Staphylococcus xylosus]|uniref:CHAP domain-containing protein n=1 Tax=Staphylococcus xylosus TaxID=1288 RepID=UPI00403E9D47